MTTHSISPDVNLDVTIVTFFSQNTDTVGNFFRMVAQIKVSWQTHSSLESLLDNFQFLQFFQCFLLSIFSDDFHQFWFSVWRVLTQQLEDFNAKEAYYQKQNI